MMELKPCPDCQLSPSPLTLDELRGMDGEPVWVMQPDEVLSPFWGIVDVANGEVANSMYAAAFEDYGVEWTAYRYRTEDVKDRMKTNHSIPSRLTKPNGDYCEEECGYFRSCKRRGRGDLCKAALYYDRLRRYENAGFPLPDEKAAGWKAHFQERFEKVE